MMLDGKGTEIPATAFNFHHGGLQLPQTHREEEQIHRLNAVRALSFLTLLAMLRVK